MSNTTEKERMLAGEWFDPLVEELTAERTRVRKLVHQFNHDSELIDDVTKRHALLHQILGRFGERCHIEPGAFMCDYGYNIILADGASINHGATFLDNGRITIGANTLVGPNVQIIAVEHPFDEGVVSSGRFCKGRPVKIGKECWIGAGAIILPGVTIGDYVIVGAGAVVNKDVPSYMTVAGVPARVIKNRTPALLATAFAPVETNGTHH